MNQLDRDHVHKRAPPYKTSSLISVIKVFVLLAAIVGLIAFVRTFKMDESSTKATQVTRRQPSMAMPATNASPTDTTLKLTATTSSEQTGNGNSAIQLTKCVNNGQAIYTDGSCPPGVKEVAVTASVSRKVSTTSSPNSSPPIERIQASEYVTNRQVAAALDEIAIKKAKCAALNKRVDELDAMARQNSQEWMRLERRKARDRQYRLGC